MTEAEWLACADPTKMLAFLQGKVGDRKLRLFAVACCRRVWNLLPDDRSRAVVEAVERHVEGRANDAELTVTSMAACAVANHMDDYLNSYSQEHVDASRAAAATGCPDPQSVNFELGPDLAAAYAAAAIADVAVPERWEEDNMDRWSVAEQLERTRQCELIRDMIGRVPFRPVTTDPAWLTPIAVPLARQMYESRDFSAMPILADALQDAGCDHPDILAHCREPGPHFRGCWVVDLVLGKE